MFDQVEVRTFENDAKSTELLRLGQKIKRGQENDMITLLVGSTKKRSKQYIEYNHYNKSILKQSNDLKWYKKYFNEMKEYFDLR